MKNLALGYIVTPPSPATSGTSLTLDSGEGARFDNPAEVGQYYVTIFNPAEIPHIGNAEIALVTARSSDTFTITRAQRGSSAQSVAAGWAIMRGVYWEDVTPSDGRLHRPEAWTRTANHVFTVSGNLTAIYRKGTYVKWAESSTVKYGVIGSSSHSSGTTTVNLIPNTDYLMTTNPDAGSHNISFITNPQGWDTSLFGVVRTIFTGTLVGNPGGNNYLDITHNTGWGTYGRSWAVNGDFLAWGGFVTSVFDINANTMRCYLNTTVSGNIRLNWMVISP